MTSKRNLHDGRLTDRHSDDPNDITETPLSKADLFLETGFTPEEYVLALIESNDRRLKQQTICDHTGWSDGTVSRILTEMEDAGIISRLRIGREKVVFLPDARTELLSIGETDGEVR